MNQQINLEDIARFSEQYNKDNKNCKKSKCRYNEFRTIKHIYFFF